jgi:hypothetical protein
MFGKETARVLSEFPPNKISPVNLKEFAHAIEAAYHADLITGNFDGYNKGLAIACIIERFNIIKDLPGAYRYLDLWNHRRIQESKDCHDPFYS